MTPQPLILGCRGCLGNADGKHPLLVLAAACDYLEGYPKNLRNGCLLDPARGNTAMKARGSEMPDGWVKPRPLQGWVQSVICNLKGLSALNVNSAFVGAIIIATICMSQSHAPERSAEEDEQIVPARQPRNQGAEGLGAHAGLEINLSLLCCYCQALPSAREL